MRIALVLLALYCLASGAKHTCGNASRDSVSAKITAASDGDTIYIPADSGNWASAITITNKGLFIFGAGLNSTKIKADEGAFTFNTTASDQYRVSGVTIYQANESAINCYGTCKNWRIDHCKFIHATGIVAVNIGSTNDTGDTWGLVDNCYFKNCRVLSIRRNGRESWKAPLSLGTDSCVYVESCIFNKISGNAIDANHGSRYVFRYNNNTNAYIECHSLQNEFAGGTFARATRSVEIYNNVLNATSENGSSNYMGIRIRAGTGVIFNNTVTNVSGDDYDGFGAFDNVRSFDGESYPIVLGSCDGENPLDGNDSASGYPCLDQVGRSTDYDTGTAYHPQEFVPFYCWGNVFDGDTGLMEVINDPDSLYHIVENRDFYNQTVKSGYTPYKYPHALTYEQCTIDSVKDVDDTIKIYGKRFLSAKGDSGWVSINESIKTAALWSDTLVKVAFSGTYENAIVKNAGSFKDTNGTVNSFTLPFSKVINKKFNARKDTVGIICSTTTVKGSFWLYAATDTTGESGIVDSSIGLSIGNKDTLQCTLGTRFLKLITRTAK